MFNRSAASPGDGRVSRNLRVYDCRSANKQQTALKSVETNGLDFGGFLQLLHRKFGIRSHETFVLATTDREVLDCDKFEELKDGSTLHLLQQEDQALAAATEENITFTPHYDTLLRGGDFQYNTTDGRRPLSYAVAELIDNSLSATVKNTGLRTIEIRSMLDETMGKPAVIVIDNGCGMTSKQLRIWAVYRLSKFYRENDTFGSKEEGYVRPDPVPRSLNSDISYFGVGGKKAVFFIGDSVRMISKPVGSPDVHELLLSREDFERKERNKEDIYSGTIRNRKPGDSSHVDKDDERFLHTLIAEERGKESFTVVVIMGVFPQHISHLKKDFEMFTRQLAHIYHYYIHGVTGKDMRRSSTNADPKIDIQVTLREKPYRLPRTVNLREVDDDMQTLYINSAVDTFEFKASANRGTVEGVMRYHPFLYDRETYPEDPFASQAPVEGDDVNEESGSQHHLREKRPIFECFWNGRLIPNTKVAELDWCAPPSNGAKDLTECYNRVSGALFTDDRFEVNTSKITFKDLGAKLREKNTIFSRVVNGQSQRGNIQKEFTQWLADCHENWDKQIKFVGYKKTITRTDVPVKRKQHPWATYSSIEWDGQIFKIGQLVKSQKTQPILYGSVIRFLLFGEHNRDVFATGGEVEMYLEPRAFHDKKKTIPISKIDKNATYAAIKKNIDKDDAKLPDTLKVEWPDDNCWPQNDGRPAGTPLGPLKIEILNKKGESLSHMPTVGQGLGKKLVVELKVVLYGPKGDCQDIYSAVASHTKSGFWFKKIDKLTHLGKYSLFLTTMINETNATAFGGRELPSHDLKFTITEGRAESFVVGSVSGALRVGVPFKIPLLMKDDYGHLAKAPPDLEPVLRCSDLDVSYDTVDSSGTTLTIRGVKAKGKVLNNQQSKTYDLKVTLPGLKKNTQIINFSLLPGNPHSLHVMPAEDLITVQNGNSVMFNIEVHDEAGNITANPKQIVQCQVQGLPLVRTDCSTTGAGQLLTKPIHLKIVEGQPQKLKVEFQMACQKKMLLVVRELKVLPSARVSRMELCSANDENLVLKNNEKIEWLAGSWLENLFYKLYDEAGREVPPTAEIASRIKVNWTSDVNLLDLVMGKLPHVQVPTQVQEARFYQVSYQDQSVSASFHIVPRPDEATRLKATLLQSTVKLGEILLGNINLELVDQYDNGTKTLTSTCVRDMTVDAEGLDKSTIKYKWLEGNSSVLVTGVQFRSGTPGHREMFFTYKSFVERVIIKVTAGVPAHLKLVSGPEMPLQVFSDHGITTPFLVQLCDEWENPCIDQRVVVELKCSPPMLKMMTSVTSQPVNAEGKASFTVNNLSGRKGYYQLEFKGSLNQKPLPGPSVTLAVIPDPTKPVRLSVEFNTSATFPAGGHFPVFSVTVVSDEGSPMTTFNPAAVSMLLWKGEPSGKMPPQTATELKCSKPMENEKNDCFRFRDKEIPEHVGKHTIQFSLRIDRTKVLYSKQIPVIVVANRPVKLGPDSQPPDPVVSYSKAIDHRTLVENMTLRIMDSYGNPAGQHLNGKVLITIQNPGGDGNKSLPLFETKTNSMNISLVDGKAHIDRLAIMENSPGEDGSLYLLIFNPEVSMGPTLLTPTPLAPFKLPFHFLNDAENQRKVSELSKKKYELTAALDKYQDTFKTRSELFNLMDSYHKSACSKEADLRSQLIKRNVAVAQTIPDIDRLITEKNRELATIQDAPRRVFSLQDRFRGQHDVLGMVGHLAFVRDDDAARVISWHIRGDMDCVITKTTTAAQRIYNDTLGGQQVMALDSIYVQQGNRPLPHIRNGRRLFDPPGNPVFARELLIFPSDQESCNIVFKNILGETILIDDLDSGNNYRREVVQNQIPCPTILTRQGDRISGKGKFGGSQNRAPPMNSSSLVFGAPLPQQYHTLQAHLDLLIQHRLAVDKRDHATRDLNESVQIMKSPEMLQQKQEMEAKKRQLEEIERQLVLTPARPQKRGFGEAGEPSGIMAKRANQRGT